MTTVEVNGAAASSAVRNRGAVSLVAVTKIYNGRSAVCDATLDIEAGEFISLLGPSGCGKTTLLRILGGFEQPTRGDVLLDGVSILNVPPEQRVINTVFQSYALFPHMNVAQNIAFGLRQRKVGKQETGQYVAEALAMVHMSRFAKHKPAMLSGGQQQRVAVARALVNRPDVLLLDEPMSALDRKLREEMQIELKLLQRELGITFIFVTHDQEEALAMSDRIAVMSDGCIVQIGNGDEIYSRPADRFVADFIGKQNFFEVVGHAPGAVHTDDGIFYVDPVDIAGGDEIVVAVRPELISFDDGKAAADPEQNSISGIVSGISFLGDMTQVVVTTTAGNNVMVRGVPRNIPPLQEGQPVRCTFSRADTRVYKK